MAPIYEYRCRKCGHEYEQRRSFADMDKRRACPEPGCRSRAVVRKVSMNFAVVGAGAAGGAGGDDFGGGDDDFGGMGGMDDDDFGMDDF